MAKKDRELEIALEQQSCLEHPSEIDGIVDRPIWH
jgi:hypothetical protein